MGTRQAADPVNQHVGERIRRRRSVLGLTQRQLGDRIDVRFQQIQKYESGANRVSVGRLWALAGALGVSVSYFFQGLGDGQRSAAHALRGTIAARQQAAEIAELCTDLPVEKRTALLALIRAMVAGE